jgi:hypothetical protein
MYVPAMLAQGKMLYRDVWFGYGPLGPYVNAALFGLFGIHLNTLYWAGSLAALGCAVLLFLTGRHLSSALAGWTAGAVVLIEAFHAWHFSFPLAYSFSSVYGALTACLFLWCVVRASCSPAWQWTFAAGIAAAVALLFKLEFGLACYAALALLLATRALREKSAGRLATDVALICPGVLAVAWVVRWMVSIAGVDFILQENLASTWPGSFFMRTYGRAWLEGTGLALTTEAFLAAAIRSLFFAGVLFLAYLLFWRRSFAPRAILLRLALFAPLLAYSIGALDARLAETLAAIFFPQDMVLYVLIAVLLAWLWYWRNNETHGILPLALVLAFAAALALRTLLKTTPWGYSIYYNGPAVLSFLILARPLVPRAGRLPRVVLRAEALVCIGCLAAAALFSARFAADFSDRVPLATHRGTIFVPNQVAANYRAAIDFMRRETALGNAVLSIPEDTSLYFLSGTASPTRLFLFTPGLLAPGKMTDDVIREIETKRVKYLIWSNRSFPDYGVPRFGADFDQALGSYLTARYRKVGPMAPDSYLDWQVSFTLWERKPEASAEHLSSRANEPATPARD